MSSTGEEKFCLRWNDFENNISSSIKELKDDQDFFDVTLACNGDKQVQAHKVILSACSPFFRSILKKNPHQHPLLYLKGVKYEEVLSVLNFMYLGEVNVAQEDLTSFLAVAKELEVKGLTQDNKETRQKPTVYKSLEKVSGRLVTTMPSPTINKQRNIPNYDPEISGNEDIVPQIKTEEPVVIDCDPDQEIPAEPMLDNNDYQAHTSEYDYDQDYVDQGQDEQYGAEVEQGQNMDLAQDFGVLQKIPRKSGWSDKKNVPCEICFKTFSSKDSLRNHLGIHKGRTTCSICQKVFATISSLNLHIKNSHARDQ